MIAIRSSSPRRRGNSNLTVTTVITFAAWLAVILTCSGLLFGWLLPAVNEARNEARYLTSVGRLKQLGLALHNYHDVYGCFPPPYVADEQGRPMHSWRVLILPYIEAQDVYDRYDFDEPWDGPNNILLIHERPISFENARLSYEDDSTTTYQAITGPGTCFDPTAPSVSLGDIKDKHADTLLLVESCGKPIIWTEPDDISPAEFLAGEGFEETSFTKLPVLMADTSYLPAEKGKLKAWRRCMTRAAGD
ncbi:DUF1559 domain-containing protein [Blastopirellula marina]|uniref:DUF1559 domain-containing protein n=1 Tax=Blastopirellula marina TaxID=124 RepID=A0A2S8FT42_9BACT|nr:DUF1559 domain-containing protein [Blastopirellula marina]PQO35349.1 hypothetical protein C5Y98_13345 [Blastopirellula marina]PTL43989.1 DUF1559 domain-containing protein [Blastopirellula marina]